ncbi:uncharacterized protein LOC126907601 isoform X2 [Daktulosphaira vitifoliae]|uniref:uncharacterized protein LOC126907601 isoform X2 n=1 Tax=Daktulosphaira vitifoliae TaxID=58002 RepID=UPI0021A9EC9B|nr:uncharacterized protein LOC126907601 isoform X2 [Daktulosphaira vitifoliae]
MENLGIQKLNSLTQSDIKNESKTENVRRIIDITRDKPIKVSIKVAVPARDHPKFNFVGKLLGPKGNSLKRLQEETITKMAILGRGSMRDRSKDYNDEIRQEQMWEMQVMQTNGNSCDATDSDTGESGLSLHSVDDNGLNFCTSHSISDYSPVHTKRNTDQTIIKCSETAGRKRPLIVGECTKITTNPSKRSVMAILARARATQLHRKEIVAFSPHFNGVV